MYLCGHPGTGKTSSLNFVLSNLKSGGPESRSDLFIPLLFNAMTYTDVKSFTVVLYEQLYDSYYGELPKRRINRLDYDDDEMLQRCSSFRGNQQKTLAPFLLNPTNNISCSSYTVAQSAIYSSDNSSSILLYKL